MKRTIHDLVNIGDVITAVGEGYLSNHFVLYRVTRKTSMFFFATRYNFTNQSEIKFNTAGVRLPRDQFINYNVEYINGTSVKELLEEHGDNHIV
jgi:hypothetical protein